MLCVTSCLVLPPLLLSVSAHLFYSRPCAGPLPFLFLWACLFICHSLSLWAVKQFNNPFWHDCLSVMKTFTITLFFFLSVGLKIEEFILLPFWGVEHSLTILSATCWSLCFGTKKVSAHRTVFCVCAFVYSCSAVGQHHSKFWYLPFWGKTAQQDVQ